MTKIDCNQDAMALGTELIELFNRRDFAGILAAGGGQVDYTEIGTGRHITDPDEFVAALEGWTTALPDVRGTVLSAMRDGDRLAIEIQWEGTHTGPLETPSGTLPASGNRTSTRAVEIHTIRDGRVVDTTHYLDVLGLLTQISAVPAQGVSAEERASANA
jgi:steroid delta-isomerase-like uncharacterized protein